MIFYLNPNGGYFLIYIYVLSKWRVKYKWRNEDIYLNGINGNKVRKLAIRVAESTVFRGAKANSRPLEG